MRLSVATGILVVALTVAVVLSADVNDKRPATTRPATTQRRSTTRSTRKTTTTRKPTTTASTKKPTTTATTKKPTPTTTTGKPTTTRKPTTTITTKKPTTTTTTRKHTTTTTTRKPITTTTTRKTTTTTTTRKPTTTTTTRKPTTTTTTRKPTTTTTTRKPTTTTTTIKPVTTTTTRKTTTTTTTKKPTTTTYSTTTKKSTTTAPKSTTTQISTSTTKPTTTTTYSTTTAPTTTAKYSSTTKHTTKRRPTTKKGTTSRPMPPTPTPAPKKHKWHVVDSTNNTCILLEAGFSMFFDYKSAVARKVIKNYVIHVPLGLNQTIATGICGKAEQEINIAFFKNWALAFTFTLDSAVHKYYVSKVRLTYEYSPKHFPGAKDTSMLNNATFKGKLFETNVNKTFVCEDRLSWQYAQGEPPHVDVGLVKIETFPLQVEAFRKSKTLDFTDKATYCGQSTSVWITILAVVFGVLLIGVVVLIIYLVVRCKRRGGYYRLHTENA